MTFSEYKSTKKKYNKILDELSDKLNSFPKHPDGRITDEARKKPEYQQLKKSYDFVFSQYRNFNSLKESKQYAKKLYQERLSKRRK